MRGPALKTQASERSRTEGQEAVWSHLAKWSELARSQRRKSEAERGRWVGGDGWGSRASFKATKKLMRKDGGDGCTAP